MRSFLLFGALMFVQFVYGQDTYYKSSIVTLQNDTIQGFISNVYDSKSIKFKKKKNDKPKIYAPKELKGFILDGNFFESRRVNVPYYKKVTTSMTSVGEQLEKDIQRQRFVDTVFIQKLVNGEVNLFKFRNLDGFTYFFAEKNKILKELPPPYAIIEMDSNTVRSMLMGAPYKVITYTKDDYLDTLGVLFNERRYITNPSKMFKHSQKSLTAYVTQFNKKKGMPNGGILKSKISQKIFVGINAGLIKLNYDKDISEADLAGSYAFKLYGLYPLMGVNRNVFAKFGLNYFTYRNDYYKKSIPSASFGLRYNALSGIFRPYFEGSIAVASLNRNNRPIDIGFPFILEAGANIPVKDKYLTLGISHTPVMVYKLNGYKLWSFNIGMMF